MAVIKKRLKRKTLSKRSRRQAKAETNEFNKYKISFYLNKGLDVKDAAILAGVSKEMLGEARSDPDFEDFVQECSANCELEHLDNIADAGSSGRWKASAWILERRFPDKYGKVDTVKHEYEMKLGTLTKVLLDVVNKVDPLLKQKIVHKLQEIKYSSRDNLLLESPIEAEFTEK